MSRSTYLWCETGNHLIRTDNGEFCEHYIAKHSTKGVESVTVIFRGPDGKITLPWQHDAPCPPGSVREEVRGPKALRRLEKELDAKDLKRHRDYVEKEARLKAPGLARRRADLHQIIRDGATTVPDGKGGRRTIHVSPFGREIARHALARMERGYSDRYDPGNHRRD